MRVTDDDRVGIGTAAPTEELEVFPNTDARAYWTGQQNFMAQRHYWTVNFCTGHHYGRFYPEQEMAVRLLRDR